MPKSHAWVQLIDPLVTLNRLVSRSFFFPATFFFLSNVVLLSLHFLSIYLQHVPAFIDSFLDVDVILALLQTGLDDFWTWFKWFWPSSPVPITPKVSYKTTKTRQTNARRLLKLMMQAAAFVPHMGTSETPYQGKQGLPQPDKIIRNTATLSAFNLQELKKRLSQSTMYSLYSSMVKSPVRPVILDTGASACTSPFKDAFVP